jgi:predicted nucleotidyltransferase
VIGYAGAMARLSPGEEYLLNAFLKHLHARAPADLVASVRVFGSRARGHSNEFSDLDVAVELAPGQDWVRHRFIGAEAAWDAMEETDLHGLHLSAIVVPAFAERPSSLAANIAREGMILWQR